MLSLSLIGIIVGIMIGLTPSWAVELNSEASVSLTRGQQLYDQACLLCHGKVGEGDGPDAFYLGAYSSPRPRAFTGGEFKFRSTPSGDLPIDYDLFETITQGIPGYMPSFESLSESERWDIVAYLKQFSPTFSETANQPIDLPPGPLPLTAKSIQRGQELYELLDCVKCHGSEVMEPGGLYDQGELRDRRELDVLPRDLHQPSSFKNGHHPRDIALSIMTGLDGTPMAAYREALSLHPEDIWHLVNYLLSLSAPQ